MKYKIVKRWEKYGIYYKNFIGIWNQYIPPYSSTWWYSTFEWAKWNLDYLLNLDWVWVSDEIVYSE